MQQTQNTSPLIMNFPKVHLTTRNPCLGPERKSFRLILPRHKAICDLQNDFMIQWMFMVFWIWFNHSWNRYNDRKDFRWNGTFPILICVIDLHRFWKEKKTNSALVIEPIQAVLSIHKWHSHKKWLQFAVLPVELHIHTQNPFSQRAMRCGESKNWNRNAKRTAQHKQ